MWTAEEIRQRLAAFAGDLGPAVSLVATVTTVDADNCTCTLNDDGLDYFEVRLLPVTGGNKGFVQIPKKGAQALAVRVEDSDEWALVACSEIEKIQLIIANDSVYSIMSDFIAAIRNMKFTTNMGPTIKLINDADFVGIQERISKILY